MQIFIDTILVVIERYHLILIDGFVDIFQIHKIITLNRMILFIENGKKFKLATVLVVAQSPELTDNIFSVTLIYMLRKLHGQHKKHQFLIRKPVAMDLKPILLINR